MRLAGSAVDHEHRVTPRELFFDLVFVFAFTQVATLLADDPTFAGIGRGVLVLAALWWTWTAYAWLTNTVDPEEGAVDAARRDPDPARGLHGRHAHLALARRARVRLCRRRAQWGDGLANTPVALRGTPWLGGDHCSRLGVHRDRDRRDRDRHRAGRGRGGDPRDPGRHVDLARLLRLLLDPRRTVPPQPRGPGTGSTRPRSVRVRAFPDDRRHRALRVRDEGHRRTRRRGARLRPGLRALRRKRALPADLLGDADSDRTATCGGAPSVSRPG